ncbi:MAG: hypothetical protein M3256_21130 [Actinomycetota bacterium]|nr:hypothetical protein [Actinomycetota bacterium]
MTTAGTPEASGGHWRPLARSPLNPRIAAGALWTGTNMLVWGGFDGRTLRNDGGAYDPVANRWELVPDAPLSSRSRYTLVWTGKEMVVWGGWGLKVDLPRVVDQSEGPQADGAAYDPATRRWRAMAPAPIEGRGAHSAVWTGKEMVVWGGSGGPFGPVLGDGAAYDPATDRWRPITAAPLAARSEHSGTWTGSAMILWGGDHSSSGNADVPDGAAYDPSTDSWTMLPPGGAGLGAKDIRTAWTGSELLLVGGFGPGSGNPPFFGAAYNPSRGQWRTIASPIPDMAGSTVLWTGDELLVWARGSKSARYNPTTDRWAAIPALRLRPREEMTAVWTGTEAIVWGGSDPSGSPFFGDGAALTLTG